MFDNEVYLLAKAEAKIVRFVAYRVQDGQRLYFGSFGEPTPDRDEAIRFQAGRSGGRRGFPLTEIA